MKRLTTLLVLALGMAACQDTDTDPTTPGDPQRLSPVGASADIVEQGNGHFFFLPPLDAPDAAGDFNPDLRTEVQVCEWDQASAECVADPVQAFTSDEILVSETDEQYHVDWRIRDTDGVEVGTVYAIRVLTGGVPIGFAEVVFGRNGQEADQLAAELGVVGFNRNQTLPIKYRVEFGLFCEGECFETTVTEEGGTFTTENEQAGASLPPGAVPEGTEVTLIIEEVALEPGEQCLGVGVPTTGRCMRFDTEPRLEEGFDEPVVVAFCYDRAAVPDPDRYLIHRFDPEKPEEDVEALPSAASPFLTCGQEEALLDAGPFRRLAHAGWRGLLRVVGPSPLMASDEGFGGTTSRFSNFQWATAVELVPTSATTQTGLAAEPVDAPTVQVLTEHNHASEAVPVPGEPVTFVVKDVDGTVLSEVTVPSSDPDGFASIPWTLSANPGTQTVEVTTASAGRALFSAEALVAATDIAAGAGHACALTHTGDVYCWGANDFQQLGIEDAPETCEGVPCSTTPVLVEAPVKLVKLDAAHHHNCALGTDGQAYCWGGGGIGQLGDGGTVNRARPAAVAGGRVFDDLTVGTYHTCAITPDGQTYCWGSSADGPNLGGSAFGIEITEECANPYAPYRGEAWNCSTVPVASGGGGWTDAVGAGLWFSCGLDAGGAASCAGWNSFYQLGTGEDAETQPADAIEPVPVSGGFTFSTLRLGVAHACGLDAAGAAYCWGARAFNSGQLGTGSFEPASTPAPVAGGISFRMVVPARANNVWTFTCGVSTSDQPYCWGDNGAGQLGFDGGPSTCGTEEPVRPCVNTPQPVPLGASVKTIATGSIFTCAVTTGLAGEVYCWGQNRAGQLGDGSTVTRAEPRRVSLP